MGQNFFIKFPIVMIFIIFSRLWEIYISQKNEKLLLSSHQAKLLVKNEHYYVLGFHIFWFLSLFAEALNGQIVQVGYQALLCYLLIGIAQILRVESMDALGIYWTMKIN